MRHVLQALAFAAGMSLSAPSRAAVAFSQGMVSITIDDGFSTQWTDARVVLNQRGIKSTYYIITDAVAEGWSGYLNLQQLQTLAADGNEIASHTLTHVDLTTVSDAELQRQVSQSKAWLLASAGVTSVADFASPYGKYDARILDALRPLYASHRTVLNLHNWQDGDPYELGAFDVHNGVTSVQVKGWIDQAVAEQSWLILLFHEFTTGTPNRSTQIRTSDFTAILDYLAPVKKVTVSQGLALMHPAPPAPPVAGMLIYEDTLASNFQDWSWATHDLTQMAVVHTGARAISFEPDAWAGLVFHHATPINTALYSGVELWIHGGTTGGQAVNLQLFLAGQDKGSAAISDLMGTPIPAGAWKRVFMPFGALGISGTFDDLYVQDGSGLDQAKVYIDGVRLLPI